MIRVSKVVVKQCVKHAIQNSSIVKRILQKNIDIVCRGVSVWCRIFKRVFCWILMMYAQNKSYLRNLVNRNHTKM